MRKFKQASNNLITLYLSLISLLLIGSINNGCKKDDTLNNNEPPTNLVYDIDNNVYDTIIIGTQVWMVQNLKVTRLNDGTKIPEITSDAVWDTLSSYGYGWYNNDIIANKDIYGALYNWHVIETEKLCPKGWHVPSDSDWTELSNFLGGESIAGGKLKSTGTIEAGTGLWHHPNLDATDEYGFHALPGGFWYPRTGDDFIEIGLNGYWWSSTGDYSASAWFRIMRQSKSELIRYRGDRNSGLSVRCIKNK